MPGALHRYRTRLRERFLTDEEYCRLGRALDMLEAKGMMSWHATATIRLLVLTGCRRNEVPELRWDDVDRPAGERRLRDGKTGARMVPLSPAVLGVLEGIPRVPDIPWVIVGQKPDDRLVNVGDPWLLVRAEARLDGVRIHDLRHSWASRALALGESQSMIGKLLGHSQVQTTARYAHLARDTVHEAARRVSDRIEAGLYRDCPGFAIAD